MSTKYTPGPWKSSCGYIEDKSGDIIAELNRRYPVPEKNANAALIAAAPEILNSLEILIDSIEQGDPEHIENMLVFSKRAVSKAKGAL